MITITQQMSNGTIIEERSHTITVRDTMDDNRLIAGYSKTPTGWLCEAGPMVNKTYSDKAVRMVANRMAKSRGVTTENYSKLKV